MAKKITLKRTETVLETRYSEYTEEDFKLWKEAFLCFAEEYYNEDLEAISAALNIFTFEMLQDYVQNEKFQNVELCVDGARRKYDLLAEAENDICDCNYNWDIINVEYNGEATNEFGVEED